MIGNPKYNYNDYVQFSLIDSDGIELVLNGFIYVIDKYGVFENNTDVHYDIMVEKCDKYPDGVLFKHVIETAIIRLKNDK